MNTDPETKEPILHIAASPSEKKLREPKRKKESESKKKIGVNG
jgi:hypothetical protein